MKKNDSFRFEELHVERTFVSPELQGVAKGNPWTEHRKQYKVLRDGIEVAYVSFDFDRPEGNNLYLLYVAKGFRGQGIGSRCLEFAVELTKELKRPRLTVLPRHYEESSADPKTQKRNQKKLEQWYRDGGFRVMRGVRMFGDQRLFAIKITPPATASNGRRQR